MPPPTPFEVPSDEQCVMRVEAMSRFQTEETKRGTRARLLSGATDVGVGTHALLYKKNRPQNLGLAVVDEQHKFGVEQRERFISSAGTEPDVLVMTATPIPRTLTLTLYGDLDVSVIDEMPAGRGEIVTPKPELAGWSRPLVLLKPQFAVSTPYAYKNLTCSRRLKGINYGTQELDDIQFVNELERPVFAKFPVLAAMKTWLLEQEGARVALMSGSGSSVFALTDTPEQAKAIAEKARQELDPTLFVHCGTVNPQP